MVIVIFLRLELLWKCWKVWYVFLRVVVLFSFVRFCFRVLRDVCVFCELSFLKMDLFV